MRAPSVFWEAIWRAYLIGERIRDSPQHAYLAPEFAHIRAKGETLRDAFAADFGVMVRRFGIICDKSAGQTCIGGGLAMCSSSIRHGKGEGFREQRTRRLLAPIREAIWER